MKKLIPIIFAMVLIPLLSQAQDGQWTFEGVFPPDSTVDDAVYNITIDAEGKIWMHEHYLRGKLRSDSTKSVVDIQVYNPDGTQADFSPVQQVTIDGETHVFDVNGRGLQANADGDILFAHNTELYLIDHKTGEGIAHVSPNLGTSLTNPAVDGAGNVYVTGVVGGAVKEYPASLDTTDSNGKIVIESVPAIGRTLSVTEDGNTLYIPRFTGPYMLEYNRTKLTPFGAADTLLRGAVIESMSLDPHNGDLWASTGSTPDTSTSYTPYTWYGFDTDTWEVTDSVTWVGADDLVNATQPQQAIAFSHDANTLYLGVWQNNVDATYAVQKFSRDNPVSIEREVVSNMEGYKLQQNYPNPFNPTTNINYTLKTSGQVTLKVYDMTGREVATLVNTRMNAGEYTATFDASNLASGVYLYSLETNGLRLTNRMTLIK